MAWSGRLVSKVMALTGIYGFPGLTGAKRLNGGVATADDLVHRKFHRLSLNEFWVDDIMEHPSAEGKVDCGAVLDACSRKILGWAIDSNQYSMRVMNAVDMAIRARTPASGGVVRIDHGIQFTS